MAPAVAAEARGASDPGRFRDPIQARRTTGGVYPPGAVRAAVRVCRIDVGAATPRERPMDRARSDELVEAFRLASRGDPARATPALVAWALRMLAARRAGLAATPCPTSVVRRIESWLPARPRGLAHRLLALVPESGRSARPALRGSKTTRTLRCTDGRCTVDTEVVTTSRGRVARIAVTPALPGMVAEVRVLGARASRRVRLDATGVGEFRLPAASRSFSAVFRVGGVATFRVADLPVA